MLKMTMTPFDAVASMKKVEEEQVLIEIGAASGLRRAMKTRGTAVARTPSRAATAPRRQHPHLISGTRVLKMSGGHRWGGGFSAIDNASRPRQRTKFGT